MLQVIAGKLGMDSAAFAELGSGVYLMHHRTKKQAKWVGLSPDLCRTLCGYFFQLYHKECSQLSPIGVELKFFSPLAADWDIQVSMDCRAKRVGTGESQEDCGVQDPQALWPQHLPHFYWQRDMGGVQPLVPGQEKKAEVKSTVLNSLAVASHDNKQVQKIANYLQLQLPSAWQWVHVPGTTAGVPEIRIVLKF